MNDSMIDRLSDALFLAGWQAPVPGMAGTTMGAMHEAAGSTSDEVYRQTQELRRGYTVAILQAMREPTDKMREAGAIHLAAGKSAVVDAIGTWHVMIDEALK